MALAHQGVRDGDVLYLVPRNLNWPEPGYDDVVEEIAAGLVAAGLVLLTGLGVLVTAGAAPAVRGLAAAGVAVVLLCAGSLLSRALGDGVAGATTAGYALPYAAAGGALLFAGGGQVPGLSAGQVLVASAALLLASVIGAVAVGHGLRVFVAGITAGIFAGAGAALGFALTGPGAASILIVALVGGIGLAPLVAVRLGKLPLPVVTAAPEELAAERRPAPPQVLAAVIRADEILTGSLLGISTVAVGCVALLAATTGVAGPLLGGLASAALILRARLFPSIAARLPLLGSGLVGLAVTVWDGLAGDLLGLIAAAGGLVAVVGLVATAATAHRHRVGGSPYLGRLAGIIDNVAVVALAPVACAVLDLYRFARGLSG